MRILVLSFYYPPDLGAGSFRSVAFIKALEVKLPEGAEVEVLTTLPNRYESFSREASLVEVCGRITIRRFQLPIHASGMRDQAKAFLSYARQVRAETKKKSYDCVYATSSRLFTAFLGARCARRMRAPLYLDIRDIFTDTIEDVLKGRLARLVLPLLKRIERYTIRSADGINFVSAGFTSYFSARYPGLTFATIPNGVDEQFLSLNNMDQKQSENRRIKILYAGNVGQGQGLHRILPELAKISGKDYEFIILGDGGALALLEKALADHRIDNVTILPPTDRETLLEVYSSVDVLFLHLNDLSAFRRVLPSKIFEYAATGKPILAGVSGYSAGFLQGEVDNVAVFPPCDEKAGLCALQSLNFGRTDRRDFVARYRRDSLMNKLVDDVLEQTKVL